MDTAPGLRAVEVADGGPTPEEILCQSETRASLLHAIGQLRENLRVIILHREFQGLTSAETAQRLGLTVSAVKARTLHARRFLRKHLERKFARTGSLANLEKRNAWRAMQEVPFPRRVDRSNHAPRIVFLDKNLNTPEPQDHTAESRAIPGKLRIQQK